ncbi:MAG: 4-alpha-glucanotransferase, partial [Candidatus Poseidoniaceae archaeon]|nr:4-alpha-glucanotransferase [Candidatus Poseidoniaceae archaeon]
SMALNSGILCHPTSLPSGDLAEAERFIDMLVDSKASLWQLLPLTPPDEHASPYSSPSAFAAWDGWVGESAGSEFNISAESYWLEDWALYQVIKKEQDGKPWFEWPDELKNRDAAAMARYSTVGVIEEQKRFMHRWTEIKEYAKNSGVSIIGDLPIFIAHDSADVWAHKELFQLDEEGQPVVVAGVPPDYFNEDGQRWGMVLYDWQSHEDEKWEWWRQRMRRMLRLFDIVRVDHFRGFHSAWAIPADAKTAKAGTWQEGPKGALIEQLLEVVDSPRQIIAEDLGIIPPEVVELRKRYDLEGMAVLHFGFDDNNADNPHRPENIASDQVVYTGTHDNDTTIGWWKSAPSERRARVERHRKDGESVPRCLIRLALESAASMAIIPLQDIMELGSEARMNMPGTGHGNWKWQFEWEEIPDFTLEPVESES